MKNNKFILAISILTSSLYSGVNVYLENNYGAKLNYRTSSAQSEQTIGTNVRVLLGTIDSIKELFVHTTSMVGSYVSPYDLQRFLDQIKNQQWQHSQDDAIISITSSGLMSWNINVRWAAKSKMSFEPLAGTPKTQPIGQPISQPAVEIAIDPETALMLATTADERLNKIKAGALGQEYARKTSEISSANYAKAEAMGKINLYSRLKAEIIAPKLEIAKSGKAFEQAKALARQRKQEIRYVLPDLAPAIEDIKSSINRLHNTLNSYKSRGEAS